MEVAIKINGTKEISLNPETPLEQEYLPLIKDGEKYLVTRDPNSNKIILKLIKTKNEKAKSHKMAKFYKRENLCNFPNFNFTVCMVCKLVETKERNEKIHKELEILVDSLITSEVQQMQHIKNN